MLQALLAAARVGAETLDPYASLRCSAERSTGSVRGGGSRGLPRHSVVGGVTHGNSGNVTHENDSLLGADKGVLEGQRRQLEQSSGSRHMDHAPSPNKTAAQELAAMLPWNCDPYLQVRLSVGDHCKQHK